MATGVQDINEKNKILTDVTRYNEWISEPKVTGSRVIRVELFITLETTLSLRELVDAQFEFIQREGLRLTVKRTGEEHTSRVGYLIGPVVDWANMKWYEEQCKKVGKLLEGEFELKKDTVYEGAEV